MIAFLNAGILYLIMVKTGLVNDGYNWFKDRIAPRFGRIFVRLITCIYCLSFWIALVEGLIGGYSLIDVGVVWIGTVVLFNLLNI